MRINASIGITDYGNNHGNSKPHRRATTTLFSSPTHKSNQIKSNLFAQTYHIYTWEVVKSVYEQGQQGWDLQWL